MDFVLMGNPTKYIPLIYYIHSTYLSNVTDLVLKLSQSKLNRDIKCQNGNILNVLHINKGNSTITTKLSLIQNLVDDPKPDLLSLNES